MPYSPLSYLNVTVVLTDVSNAYSMQETDDVIVVNLGTPGAIQINLVASPVSGKELYVKDGAGNANTYNITVAPAAGDIDGATTQLINTAYGHLHLVYNGTQWNLL